MWIKFIKKLVLNYKNFNHGTCFTYHFGLIITMYCSKIIILISFFLPLQIYVKLTVRCNYHVSQLVFLHEENKTYK